MNCETAVWDEPLGQVFEPDSVLPAQMLSRLEAEPSLQPEKRLMLAVLEEAVAVFQKHVLATRRRGKRLFAEAEQWFASRDREWPFSFENICVALDIEPDYLRRGLHAWKVRERARGQSSSVIRFPFRRVNGRRHSVTGRAVGLKRSA